MIRASPILDEMWSQLMPTITKYSLLWLMFFAYIHHLIKMGYIEARRKRLRELTTDEDPFMDIRANLNRAEKFGRLGQAARVRDSSLEHFQTTATNSRQNRQLSRRKPLQYKFQRVTIESSPIRYTTNSRGIAHRDKWRYEDLHPLDYCPLEELPIFFRIYTYITHCMLVYMFLKYVFVNLAYLELFEMIKKSYSCFWPGRTCILPELLPSFSMVVLCHHVVYRYYLCIHRKSFAIDCFIFVFFDRETVLEKETKIREIDNNTDLSLLYLNDGFFYHQIIRSTGERTLHIKCNRTLEHWTKMKGFLNNLILLLIFNFAAWGVPLGTWVLMNALSDEYFQLNYHHCVEFATRLQTYFVGPSVQEDKINDIGNLSSSNIFRLSTFFFDLGDSAWMLLDTSNALVWPFASLIVIAQDATFSVETLIDSTRRLAEKFQQLPEDIYSAKEHSAISIGQPHRITSTTLEQFRTKQLLKLIEEDSLILRNEIVDIFKQLNQADEFVSKLTAFCIYVWVVTNVYYEAVSIYKQGVLAPNSVVQYMQITAFIALTITFGFLSRTHSKTLKLYRSICNIVALDPNYKTSKADWMRVLEYFHKQHSRYTFHLGPSAELSLSSYLKSMSWCITVACVVLNLMHQTLGLTANSLPRESRLQ